MTKSDAYRANALECERMAGIAPQSWRKKVASFQMAEQWLRMIPKAKLRNQKNPTRQRLDTHPTKSEGFQ